MPSTSQLADRNRAPTVTRRQSDRTLPPGSTVVRLDLGSIFTDPDGDTLAYEAVSSDPDRLVVVRNGARVTLTRGSPGRAVVTLRATDPDGLSAVEAFTVTVAAGTRDYDSDNDGLIDVGTLAQLDALRYDLDGDGLVDGATWEPYYAAFPMGAVGMGCPSDDGCTGYELTADLDFDINAGGSADAGDTYWNAGAGWAPIGDDDAPFIADFDGDGHTVANLFIDRDTRRTGSVCSGRSMANVSSIRGIALVDVDVTGRDGVGSPSGARRLRGDPQTAMPRAACRARTKRAAWWGGPGACSRATTLPWTCPAQQLVGGLVGHQILNNLIGSYATGDVSGTDAVGGLAGAVSDYVPDDSGELCHRRRVGPGGAPLRVGFGTDHLRRVGLLQPQPGPVETTSSTGGGVGGLVGSSCGLHRGELRHRRGLRHGGGRRARG